MPPDGWIAPIPERRDPEKVADERTALEQWVDYQRATLLPFPYDPDWTGRDFDDLEGADAEANIEAFWAEVDAARDAVAGKSLDLVVPSRGDHPELTRDVRWIFIHMIEEYARHNGHADFLREAIDGTTGD
jgi:hypothetical protein